MDTQSVTVKTATGSVRSDRRATILIVEDSRVQAELLREALEGADYKVIVASNGAEGFAMAKAIHPAAVMSDINMPIMDGYALCQAIRGHAVLKHTPVILLTMLSDPQDVIRGLNAGADAYVTKPYNVPTLVSRVESLLAYPPAPSPPRERRKVEVRLAGESRLVDAHGPRMLNLLVSTYENAVVQNRELAATRQALESLNQHLEQKVVEKTAALRNSERRFRSLIEHASDLVTVVDAQGKIAYISPSVKRLVGYEVDEVANTLFLDYTHREDRPAAAAGLAELLRDPGKPHMSEFRFLAKDGTWATIESIARNALDDPVVKGIVINSRDISDRKRAEHQLSRVNWALRALSQGNSALVHAGDEQELFQSSCEAIAGAGDYPLAWIGVAKEDSERSVAIAASAGDAIDYMTSLKVSWGEGPLGHGPCGAAIRTGTTQVNNDIAANPAYAPWLEQARASGLASSVSLPIRTDGAVAGVLTVYSRELAAFGDAEVELFEQLAGDIGYGISTRRTRRAYEESILQRERDAEKLRATFESAIAALATTVEQRDPYTAGHQWRVSVLAVAIGREVGLDEQRIEGLRIASIIHDIGKISVPAEILSRPGKLGDAEFEIVKGHARAGYEIVKGVDFPWPVAQTILQHHERLDGSGYPQRLKGEQIILEARILAVADAVEAMSSHRPYRPGLGVNAALAQLRKDAGTKLDPAVVGACERLFLEKGFSLPD